MRLSHQKGARTRGGSASRPEAGRIPDDENGRQWCPGGGGGGGANPPIARQSEAPGQAAGGASGTGPLRADDPRAVAPSMTKSSERPAAGGGAAPGVAQA